ncbi:MAG: iron-sulfur cluster biosynthesis transcriptional regulator SufR [Cyanobacteria bacterium P01_A01_bin.84]
MATTQQSTTKKEILEYLLKQAQATALELSDALDISPQAVRRHIKDLEAENLIIYSSSVQEGMGRPQHRYKLSADGKKYLNWINRDKSSENYGEFAVSLLDTLAETVGKDQVGTILKKQWERKAENYREYLGNLSLKCRLEKLVELRKAEGFMAECHPVESKKLEVREHSFIITEHNCAISNVAESFPSICGHELEMFSAVLPDCTVERTHWIINGEHRCGYLVRSPKVDATAPSLLADTNVRSLEADTTVSSRQI